MAKMQPTRKAQAKKPKSISMSGIFKKAKTYAGKKTLKKSKAKHTSDHPLAIAFSESISDSREHIKQHATSSLKSIGDSLSARTTNIDKHYKEQLQAACESQKQFLQPLPDERLQFTSNDGLSCGTVVLGDRITKFHNVIKAEEKVLESLHKEWMDLQKEITAVAVEVLGAQGLVELKTGGLKNSFVTKEQKERAEELEGVKKRFLDEVNKLSGEAVERVREEEKEMKIRENKQKRRLIEFFTEEY